MKFNCPFFDKISVAFKTSQLPKEPNKRPPLVRKHSQILRGGALIGLFFDGGLGGGGAIAPPPSPLDDGQILVQNSI